MRRLFVLLGLCTQALALPAFPDPETIKAPPEATARSGILGTWLRPNFKDSAHIQLERLKNAGYTDVFLETVYHGMAIYPSQLVPIRPEIRSRNVLLEFYEAAAELDMRLHAWIEVLYWSPPNRYNIKGGLLDEHPEWETQTRDGRKSKQVATGMGFADPAIPEVQDWSEALAFEIGTLFPNVGLHIDYLRYPTGADFGYHPIAREAYMTSLATMPGLTWNRFRESQIANIAGRIAEGFHASGASGLITAAVKPEYPFWGGETRQSWETWSGIDVYIPMNYSVNTWYLQALSQYLRAKSPKPVWMGIQIGEGYPSLEAQVNTLRPEGFNNFVVFAN
ncbi:MAG: family 10 glycosylhydrolase [Deinococcaceae bacterium]